MLILGHLPPQEDSKQDFRLLGLVFVFIGLIVECAVTLPDAVMFALQLGFTDDIDPALSLKLISQSTLAFLNRHLPLTEAQRSQFKQSQALPDSAVSGTASNDVAAPSQHMPSAEGQDRFTSGAQKTDRQDQIAGQQAGLHPGQVVLDGLSDSLDAGMKLEGRTYESRVKPDEREVFENICQGNIAILELSL